jgi:hypothetical protein
MGAHPQVQRVAILSKRNRKEYNQAQGNDGIQRKNERIKRSQEDLQNKERGEE